MHDYNVSLEELNTSFPEPKKNQEEALLFVDLYLVILSFFLLLNSIAKVDHIKKEQTVDSVRNAFGNYARVVDSTSIQYHNPMGLNEIIDGIFTQMSTVLALEHIDIKRAGNEFIVRMPIHELFADKSITIKDSKLDWLDQMVSILTRFDDKIQFDVQFLIGLEPLLDANPQAPNLVLPETLAINRSGQFAREMSGRGIPNRLLMVGISSEEPDMAILTFSPRTPDKTVAAPGDTESKPIPR